MFCVFVSPGSQFQPYYSIHIAQVIHRFPKSLTFPLLLLSTNQYNFIQNLSLLLSPVSDPPNIEGVGEGVKERDGPSVIWIATTKPMTNLKQPEIICAHCMKNWLSWWQFSECVCWFNSKTAVSKKGKVIQQMSWLNIKY